MKRYEERSFHVRFLKDCLVGYRDHKKGDIATLHQWPYEFRDEKPEDRSARGFIVLCNGHGDFDSVQVGEEVELIKVTGNVPGSKDEV